MALAGYKMISMVLLVVLVALAGVSPVFAPTEPAIILNPTAACRGEAVQVSESRFYTPVGASFIGGIVLSSDPGGLIGDYECGQILPDQASDNLGIPLCVFHVSESASCGHYTVTVAFSGDEFSIDQAIMAQFDVAGPCCAAIGGCVQPVNTFALISPWLLAIGLIGCVGTVVVVAKKRGA